MYDLDREKKNKYFTTIRIYLSDFYLVHVPKTNGSNDLQNAKKMKWNVNFEEMSIQQFYSRWRIAQFAF